jgi:hypothetical protein
MCKLFQKKNLLKEPTFILKNVFHNSNLEFGFNERLIPMLYKLNSKHWFNYVYKTQNVKSSTCWSRVKEIPPQEDKCI